MILKEKIKEYLIKKNVPIIDLGPLANQTSVDYPDYAKKVAKRLLLKKSDGRYFSLWIRHRNGYYSK